MHVFVTGATGWVGSAVIDELLKGGHRVTGLVRSPGKAAPLTDAGVEVMQATLDDLDALRRHAAAADAVIHTAFDHDFSRFAENAAQDRRAIEAMGRALEGTDKPIIVTSGLSGLPLNATEDDMPRPASPRMSEEAARSVAERGVRVATVRLAPSVHGIGDHGFVPILVRTAREKGVSAYIDDGANRWSGVHRLDAARVFRLALESGVTEPVYHAVADESVPFSQIAEVIGRHLDVPVESRPAAHFGWFAGMAGGDMAVSSANTRSRLGWTPEQPTLLEDLDRADYYA